MEAVASGAGPQTSWRPREVQAATGGPAGQSDGHHEVVVMGTGMVAQVGDLIKERGSFVNTGWYPEQPSLEEDAETGDEVAARDEVLAGRVGVGLTSGRDGDRGEAKTIPGAAEQFHDGAADARGINNDGSYSTSLSR
jgi:hypothetical protein